MLTKASKLGLILYFIIYGSLTYEPALNKDLILITLATKVPSTVAIAAPLTPMAGKPSLPLISM